MKVTIYAAHGDNVVYKDVNYVYLETNAMQLVWEDSSEKITRRIIFALHAIIGYEVIYE